MRSTSAVVRYEFKPPPRDVAGLPTFLNDELPKISTAVNFALDGQFEQQTVAPAKPRAGMVRYADGVQWDPGQGEGLYLYTTEYKRILSLGSGGTVTQLTSKSTGVTLNKSTGEITMNGAALNLDTSVSFTLTNSMIRARDVLILNHVTTGTKGAYNLNAECSSGSAVITVRNVSTGNLSEAIVLRFTRIPGAIT